MDVMYKQMVLRKNITDVSFMILNMKRAAATISELANRVSFPVYQEPASQDIMGKLGGVKDDILIYDRCGLLVDHFTMPYSYMGFPFVRNSLLKVINKDSKCRKHCAVTTTTVKATPATTTTSEHISTHATLALTSESVTSQPRPENVTRLLFGRLDENSKKIKETKKTIREDTP